MTFLKTALVASALAALSATTLVAPALAETKIGFVVKQPEEPWFQDEWRFAQEAADEKGFTLVKIGAQDGEQLMSAIDNMGAQGVQGFIVCTPDVKLGPGIVAKAEANGLKLMTVDDRLVDAAGNTIDSVPHMGISATKIGEAVGESIAAEITKRGWNVAEVGAIRVSYDQLPTAVDRVEGAITALKAAGFVAENIFDAPQARTDTEAALNAATVVLNAHPEIKHWVAFGLNDEAVLGAVRASESVGIAATDVIGVGIGGSDSAINEFRKPEPTGFFASVIISPKRHGYETAINMYNWIVDGTAPEALILTSGSVATRDDYFQVRQSLGMEVAAQ